VSQPSAAWNGSPLDGEFGVLTTSGSATAGTLLRQGILDREFLPGQRIPPERELAARFGLSRSSIREAIKGLVSLNILETRRGSGTYVRLLESSEIFESLEFVLDVDPKSLAHFFELRRLLEPPAAGIAASRIVDADRQILLQAKRDLRDLNSSQQDVDKLVVIDDIIHDTITASTGNPLVHSLVKSLRETARRSHGLAASLTIDDIEPSKVELSNLIDAVCNGDSVRAQGVMMWHLESSLVGWRQTFALSADAEASLTTQTTSPTT
jgi:GntR family transcriptional repressor for pyruvate dehydrogenase complex